MPNNLNLFPSRSAIGQVKTPDGRVLDVMASPEFSRALADLVFRVGGASALTSDEMLNMLATESTESAEVQALQQQVRELKSQLAVVRDENARIAALEKTVQELTMLVRNPPAAQTDWEHPGKIGAGSINTARFTTLTVTNGLGAFNKGLSVNGPATLGNTGTTQWSWETPIMRYFLGDGTGYSLRFTKRVAAVNTDLFTFTDSGALTVLAGFGCNGKSAQSAYALGGAATDLASVITLANNLRTMAINNGTGA